MFRAKKIFWEVSPWIACEDFACAMMAASVGVIGRAVEGVAI